MIHIQFLVYIGVGLLSACVDIGTMQLLLMAGTGVGVAVTTGFAFGLVFNYVCHARVTFKATTSAYTLLKFGVLTLVNYGLTLACVWASLYWFDSVLIGKLVSLPLVALNGFFSSRYWIFRHARK